MPNAIAVDLGAYQVIPSELANSKHQVGNALYSLNDCFVGKRNSSAPLSTSRNSMKEQPNSHCIKENGTANLTED